MPSVHSQTDSTLVESVNMKQEKLEQQTWRPHVKIPNNRTVQTPTASCGGGISGLGATMGASSALQPLRIFPLQKMSKEEATIPKMLADAGVKKLTFVGGEPTLCILGRTLGRSQASGPDHLHRFKRYGSDEFIPRYVGSTC